MAFISYAQLYGNEALKSNQILPISNKQYNQKNVIDSFSYLI